MRLTMMITTLTLLCGQSAMAMNFIELAIESQKTAMENEARVSLKQSRRMQDSCTNFSGDWDGECTTSTPEGEKITKSKTKITQNRCESVTSEDETGKTTTSIIGGVSGGHVSAGAFFSNALSVMDWNNDRNELAINIDILVKATVPSGKRVSVGLAGRTYLENNQLKMELNGPAFKMSCHFNRK